MADSDRSTDAGFRTTRWSLVAAAQDTDPTRSREALAALCEAYWPPLYAFVRRRGQSPDEACDLTQAFFLQLLERHGLDNARPGAGRFRSYLMTSIKNLLLDQRARKCALKRGAGRRPIPLDADTAERTANLETTDSLTPEAIFERRWALTVLHRVLGTLRVEYTRQGEQVKFDRLKGFLIGDQSTKTYNEIAADLEMSEEAVGMAVHRLRKQYGKALRSEVAETVAKPTEVDDEIRHRLSVLRS